MSSDDKAMVSRDDNSPQVPGLDQSQLAFDGQGMIDGGLSLRASGASPRAMNTPLVQP